MVRKKAVRKTTPAQKRRTEAGGRSHGYVYITYIHSTQAFSVALEDNGLTGVDGLLIVRDNTNHKNKAVALVDVLLGGFSARSRGGGRHGPRGEERFGVLLLLQHSSLTYGVFIWPNVRGQQGELYMIACKTACITRPSSSRHVRCLAGEQQ